MYLVNLESLKLILSKHVHLCLDAFAVSMGQLLSARLMGPTRHPSSQPSVCHEWPSLCQAGRGQACGLEGPAQGAEEPPDGDQGWMKLSIEMLRSPGESPGCPGNTGVESRSPGFWASLWPHCQSSSCWRGQTSWEDKAISRWRHHRGGVFAWWQPCLFSGWQPVRPYRSCSASINGSVQNWWNSC